MASLEPNDLTEADVQVFFDRANGLDGQKAMLDLYHDWSDVYDGTIERFGRYLSPDRIAAAVAARCLDRDATIVDVACGTGLVGQALARHGFHRLTGVDLSEPMLEQAERKGCYATLVTADLAGPTDLGRFAVVVSAGVLTMGHLGAAAFTSMVGLMDRGGIIMVDIEGGTFAAQGFSRLLDASVSQGTLAGYELSEGHFYEPGPAEPAHGYFLTGWR